MNQRLAVPRGLSRELTWLQDPFYRILLQIGIGMPPHWAFCDDIRSASRGDVLNLATKGFQKTSYNRNHLYRREITSQARFSEEGTDLHGLTIGPDPEPIVHRRFNR